MAAPKNPNTLALLERARKMCDPPTWYQLSKRTGIKEATISRIRLHGKTLGDINAWKLASFLRIDAKDVMAYGAEDRAQDKQTREFWERQLPRLLPSFAIASACLWSLWGSLNDGTHGGLVNTALAEEQQLIAQPIHYANFAILLWTLGIVILIARSGRASRRRLLRSYARTA